MASISSFFRFLNRNKLYSFIELFGLCISLAFIIVIFNYSVQEYSVPGRGQKDVDKIYVLGDDSFIAMTYGTAGHLCPNIPEFESYTRIANEDRDVLVGDDYYNIHTMAVDKDFLDFFSYKLIEGDASGALVSSKSALVSKSFANKAFGGDAIGKNVSIILGSGKTDVTITGVIDDFRNNIFQETDLIINIKHPVIYSAGNIGNPLDHWGAADVFVKMAHGSDRKAVRDKLEKAYSELWPNTWGKMLHGASLTRMDEIYFSDLESDYRHGNKRMADILMIVAMVLLVSAILNYLNLSIAQSGKRAREMSTRRILGSSKGKILARYILESFYFSLICFAAGFLLAAMFRNSAETLLDTTISLVPSLTMTLIYIALLAVISVVAGVSQYLFVSRMKPVDVLKGEFTLRSKNWFSKIFIIIQSSICIILLSLAFTMQKQMNYLMKEPRGYNSENLILIKSNSFSDRKSYDFLLSEIRRLSFVKRAGISSGSPVKAGGQVITLKDGETIALRNPRIDTTAFNIYGFRIIAQFEEAHYNSGYYTQKAINLVGGLEEARSQAKLPCCGIIEDYTFGTALYDPKGSGLNEAAVVQIIPDNFNWIYGIIVEPDGEHPEAFEELNKMWNSIRGEVSTNPAPLEMHYMTDIIFGDLKGPRNTMMLIFAFMVLSVIISLLGLYAMCSYYTSQNSKSIAINKVFGAQVKEVVIKYSKSFIWSIAISIVIAVPLAYYFIGQYLNTYIDKIGMPYFLIVLAVLVSTLFSAIVICGQMLDAATENPVNSLKDKN